MKTILVIIDTITNKPQVSGFELISFAEKLAENDYAQIKVIISGENTREAAEKAALYGHDVIGLEHDDFRYPNPELVANEITGLIDEFHPVYVCLQHTMRGCQTAARVRFKRSSMGLKLSQCTPTISTLWRRVLTAPLPLPYFRAAPAAFINATAMETLQ